MGESETAISRYGPAQTVETLRSLRLSSYINGDISMARIMIFNEPLCLKFPAFGFVEFDQNLDAEQAVKECDGIGHEGCSLIVEFARGNIRDGYDRSCFECGRYGHWAHECPGRNSSNRCHRSIRSSRRNSPSRSRDRYRGSHSRRSHSEARSSRHHRHQHPSHRSRRPRRSSSRHRSRSPRRDRPKAHRARKKRGRSMSPRRAISQDHHDTPPRD
ncbi:hypothetical protein NQZ79_g321 [Umbelopsis isabellina]|nr:hypothetical protein NQZ79_g321 [Umbelopsis isabellina]